MKKDEKQFISRNSYYVICFESVVKFFLNNNTIYYVGINYSNYTT